MDEVPKDTEQPSGKASDVDPASQKRYENLLMELSRSLKAVNFYPRGHPTLLTSLDKARSAFTMALENQKQLVFAISKDGFSYQSRPVAPNNINLPPLARELFLRQVKRIFLLPELSVLELENFLRVIAMEEELFRGEGRAEDYLLDNDVEHIWFNEIKFGRGRSAPEKEEREKDRISDLDERLQFLLQALRTEKDPRKFLAYSREVSLSALRFMDEEKFEPAFEIFKVFWECFSADPTRPPLIIEGAKSAFFELASDSMMEFILRQLTLLHGPRMEEVLQAAKALDERLVEAILNKLASNEALYSHRALIQVLLQMPDLSRESVETRLQDSHWYVVRKMAFLLGEMGKSESVAPLISAVGNPDPRVVKEALKSLSKIKSVESTRYLIGLLGSKAPVDIRTHIIRLLANTGEVSAVPTLIKFLKGRGALLENIELHQEAVRALGLIGSQQAVPILRELLLKRSLIAKSRSLSLSFGAAEALGNMGGKAAREALIKGEKSRNKEIGAACRKALQAIEGPPGEKAEDSTGESANTDANSPETEE